MDNDLDLDGRGPGDAGETRPSPLALYFFKFLFTNSIQDQMHKNMQMNKKNIIINKSFREKNLTNKKGNIIIKLKSILFEKIICMQK